MYSEAASDLRRSRPSELPRLTDRVSWLHVEHAQIVQTRTALVALQADRRKVEIPVATIGALLCGPGTSITHEAASTLFNSGCVVLWTAQNGVSGYQAATPLTGSARWAQAQARLWANPITRHQAALSLYAARMPAVVTSENLTLKQLRGFEGRLVKSTYRNLVSKYRLHGWKRDPSSPDPVNIGLNVGNSILYAIALSACSAIAINPGLGIIHHGTTAALLYDLADLHKISVTIPAAFAVHASDEPARAVRLTVRDRAHKMNLSSVYLKFLTDLLTPHLQAASDDDFILDDDGKLVPGHKNWALE